MNKKKNIVLTVACLFLHCCLFAQQADDTLAQRIVLIGDAGQLTKGRHPVVDAVRQFIPLDKKTTVLFLGDNLYKNGLPDEQYTDKFNTAHAVLDSQLSIADNTPAKVYMIPGNHDWENGSRGGYDAILREQLYVDFIGKTNVKFYPEDGCPGPVEVFLGKDSSVVVIMFDSQWWMHPFDKPEIESDCGAKTKEELVAQIGDMINRNSKRLVLLACHHPFESNGIHGGFFTLKQHIFPFTDIKPKLYLPLPVIGSIYPIARSVFGTPQDIKHPNYTNMIDEITTVVKASSPNVVFVSGHDHNLQYIKKNGYNYIISGGGCKQNRTSKNRSSLYNSTSTGFSVMEVSTHKNVTITFYTVNDTSIVKTFTSHVLNFSKIEDTTQKAPPVVAVEDPMLKYKDTITVAPRKDYAMIGGLKKFFMGQNYRAEWSTPINMKVFNLKKEKGGLHIISLGGGLQTRSLRLEDKNGKEWVLRSMNKNSTKSIPENFRNNLGKGLENELNTASYPYGALIIPSMTKALDISTSHPEVVYVPDDPALGIYKDLFGNSVCILEEKDATTDGSKTKTTSKVFSKMLQENDHRPDEPSTLKARLLDIIVGDFDRHFDQWRWLTNDTGKGKLYYPIPRDRDEAFFKSNGFMLRVLSGRAMPFLKGFRSSIPRVNWLGYTARDFDRIFLTSLSADNWKEVIGEVQQELSDTVIKAAVHQLPAPIYALRGEKFIHKMISRRDMLQKEAMTYYRFVSRKVNIIGSNQKEYFKVSNKDDSLQVRVYARAKGNDTSFIMYNRVFDPSVTHEIRLFGLNDNDIFEIDSNVTSRIKLRIIGGKGYDTFDVKGHVEALLYDQIGNENFIRHSSHAKNRFSRDAPGNDKTITGFNYNYVRWPQPLAGFNDDDGMLVGAGISMRTFGFRNLPYASDQQLNVVVAPAYSAFKAQYRGVFNHVTRTLDVLLRLNYASPALHNFFGLGNNSAIQAGRNYNYYQVRYTTFDAEAMARKRIFENLHFMIGPYFSAYQNKYSDNVNTILGKPRQAGLDSASVFGKKAYLGGKLTMLLDNRNNDFFPTRGMHWQNQFTSVAGLNNNSHSLTSITSDMVLYASQREPAKVVLVMRFGVGKILTKNYEFFQALSLGADHDLAGFRKNRYLGKSIMYGGVELKVKLFDVNSYILPGPFGLTGFYNAGRVSGPNDQSNLWHGAYGFGFYYNPFNLFSIAGYAGFSGKERIMNFSLGTKINLTY